MIEYTNFKGVWISEVDYDRLPNKDKIEFLQFNNRRMRLYYRSEKDG